MRPQKLVWRIYFVFLAATLLALAAVAWNAARAFREFHQNHTAEVLLARARIIAQGLEQEPAADPARMDALCKELGRLSATRISIILPDGRVVGDTEEIPRRHGKSPATGPERWPRWTGVKARPSVTATRSAVT